MKKLTEFSVVPSLPKKLECLRDLAGNLYWCWNNELLDLFRRIDSQLWEDSRHNPVLMLGTINQEDINNLAADEGFLAHLERAKGQVDAYMQEKKTWFEKIHRKSSEKLTVAYFSAEFGITECIPIYSGGLGVLAGDHLKSASDLGLPLVGIGLMYQHGYFRQYLNIDGYQQEAYYDNDPFNMPIQLIREKDNKAVMISVDFPGRKVYARIWKAQVGRVPLYLLDTNVPENSPNDRAITYQLYGGDKEMRIQQEIMMGIGGVRTLKALNIQPTVFHMNEGHSAFLGLERVRMLMEKDKLSFNEASTTVSVGGVFTTHTPVPAGIDMFEPVLVDKYFAQYYTQLGLNRKSFLALGRRNPENDLEPFNMAYLAMTFSAYNNGVSKLHAKVSRSMWQSAWPEVPVDDIPITNITNGIHYHSWTSYELSGLLYRYLGPRWLEDPTDQKMWKKVDQIPAEELWRTHERRRVRLVAFARRKLREQLIHRGASRKEIEVADEVLEPETLTIGFARRFATYKRATLLLKDPERLKRILTNKERPVQFIFAGKAHPRDEEGKDLIRQIVHFSKDPEIRRRMVFLENYDMIVSRYMVEGVDVWLNNPRRPMEASGTSGMKVVYNGGLNLSILDGWWCEAFDLDPDVGWSIGKGEEYQDHALQDEVESKALYNLLENEVVPLFYDRGEDSLPRDWIAKMKNSLKTLGPVFNTNRMVQEYMERCYLSADSNFHALTGESFARAKALASWQEKIKQEWKSISIEKVEADVSKDYTVGSEMAVQAWVKLGQLSPEDVSVQVYFGLLSQRREIILGEGVVMEYKNTSEGGISFFEGSVKCTRSGQHGYTVRVLPLHQDMVNPYELKLIVWQ